MDYTKIIRLFFILIITEVYLGIIAAHLCIIRKQFDPTTDKLRWAVPRKERCNCQRLVAIGIFQNQPCFKNKEDDEDPWWFIDDPTPLTNRNNWVPAILDDLLQRECSYPLGIEDGSISDDQIDASKSWQDNRPYLARLHSSKAWITDTNEWIQVRFTSHVRLAGIQTQGDDGSKYVNTLQISTADISLQLDEYIMDGNTAATFTANSDSSSVATIMFPEPVCAKFLKIHFITCDNGCAFRFEVLGFKQCSSD